MLNRLVELFIEFMDLFRFWVVVQEGDRTIIYTLGRPTRNLKHDDGIFWTGFHFKGPLRIEIENTTSVREEVINLANQSFTTKDGKQVHARGVFRYQVVPEKVITYQTTLGNEDEALAGRCSAAILEVCSNYTLEELNDPSENSEVRKAVLDEARKKLNHYGFKLYSFEWQERVAVRTIRIITGM